MLIAVDSSLGGRRDFPRMAQEITIPAADNLRDDFTASIPITNDNINEALEGFLILVETSEDTSTNTEAPIIIYRNDGLTIGLIVDDDGQSTPHVCGHTCSKTIIVSVNLQPLLSPQSGEHLIWAIISFCLSIHACHTLSPPY